MAKLEKVKMLAAWLKWRRQDLQEMKMSIQKYRFTKDPEDLEEAKMFARMALRKKEIIEKLRTENLV